MANSSSCCCAGLPKGWWWLLTLVGLPLLFFSMLTSKLSPIEEDLEVRTMQGLTGQGIEASQVSVESHGRDIYLTGQAASAEERDNIIKLATQTGGVRTVDGSGIQVQALTSEGSEDKASSADTTAMEPEGVAPTVDQVKVAEKEDDAEAAELAEKGAAEKEAAELAEKEAADKEEAELAEKEAADKEEAELAEKEAADKKEAELAEKEEAENALVEKCQKKIDSETKDKVILFATNSAKIKNESFALLDNVSNVIKECKDAFENKTLLISGHTDSRGKDDYNLSLSKRRADAVKAYLKKADIDSSLMESKGFGETQPIASNNNSAGRAKNRRITFSIE